MARLSLVASGLLLMAATPCFGQQNVTSPAPTEPTTSVPTAPTPQQNQTSTTPMNGTAGGQQGQSRPSALSQLELNLLGNHSWFDPNHTLQFFQNDYQIINHSPNEICNVTLSAPLVNPEQTSVQSSYNVKISNSTQMRGIDILAPFGPDNHAIPANGVMNIGYILMHPLSGAPGNMTAEENVSTGPVTIQTAQYCDELPGGGAAGAGAGTSGMSGSNTTTTTGGTNTTAGGNMGMGGMGPSNNTTTTTTVPSNTNTTMTPSAGGGARKNGGGKNKQKYRLRQ